MDCIKGHQPLYGPIYSLKLVELVTLNTYIQTTLANGLIKSFKVSVDTFILFLKKLDGRLWLYVSYKGFENLTIKN